VTQASLALTGVGGFRGEDLAQTLDVRELRLTCAHLLPQACDELGSKDVDATVEDAPPEGDFVLLGLEVADRRAKLVVGKSREIRKWFHS